MAWNRSDDVEISCGNNKQRKPLWLLCFVAALLVVGIAIALFCLTPSASQVSDKENSANTIATHPRVANMTNSVVARSRVKQNELPSETLGAPCTNGEMQAQVKSKKTAKPFRIIKSNRGKKLFHTIADICISRVVNTVPGNMVFGTMNYTGFEEKFRKALKTPITIEPDDTPEEIEKKKAVIEGRKELKKLLDSGEDIGKVMQEAEQENRRLAKYREQLRKDLAQAMKERKFKADDMQDYIDAANKMLTDNGMKPLKYPQFWVNRLRREQEESKAK